MLRRVLGFVQAAGELKEVERAGWRHSGVEGGGESVAAHSWGVAMLAASLPPPAGVEVGRAIQMGLAHDLAEAVTGDVLPHELSGVEPCQKQAAEERALSSLAALALPHSPLAADLLSLWREFEAASTPTARWVRDLDRADMLIQAVRWERLQPGLDLQSFFDSALPLIVTPQVRQLMDELVQQREQQRRRQARDSD